MSFLTTYQETKMMFTEAFGNATGKEPLEIAIMQELDDLLEATTRNDLKHKMGILTGHVWDYYHSKNENGEKQGSNSYRHLLWKICNEKINNLRVMTGLERV